MATTSPSISDGGSSVILATDIGELGDEWVRECLRAGRRLSRYVLAQIDLRVGSTFVLGPNRPEPITAMKDLELAYGRDLDFLNQGVETLLWLAAATKSKEHLSSMTMIVEDDLRVPSDPAIRRAQPMSVVAEDNVVYHWLPISDLTTSVEVSDFLLSSASGYPLNGFLVGDISMERFKSLLRKRRLHPVLDALIGIVNSVFDGDAYSLWVPDSIASSFA